MPSDFGGSLVMGTNDDSAKQELNNERNEILQQSEDRLETPMFVLGFARFALIIIDLTGGLSSLLQTISTVISDIFILDVVLKVTLALRKRACLKSNSWTDIPLAVPALRVYYAARMVGLLRLSSAARGLRLARVFISLNCGMKALGASMKRRGFGYIVALAGMATLAGAARLYAFESKLPQRA
jgi:voltage-gated potassium channel